MLKKTIFIYTLLIMYSTVYSQTDMAVQMAKTIMKQYSDSLVVKKYINHLMQDNLLQGNMSEADIEKANRRPANWNYEIGVVLTGFDRLWRSTGNQEYLKYTKKIIDHFLDSEGNIRTYHMDEFNIDNIPPGRQLISLYQVYKDKKYLKAAEKLKYQLDWQPRTKEGGYWHKLKYPYQMWLDGLYMGQPFRAEYLMLTGNDQEWDDVANQFIMMANGARDKKTGLMYHAFDESRVQRWSNAKTGHSPEFWSRAMGWYILGLVDVLEIFPETHPKKKELNRIFEQLTDALVRVQDPASGVWWQVTDKPFAKDNYLESSGSSMFVAAMLKGIRLGYLSEKYMPAAIRGYEGILNEFVTKDAQGTFHLNRAVSGAGLGGSPYRDGSYEYYVKEPKRDDDLKAIGPFMQAAIEYELKDKQSIGKGKTVLLDRYFNNEYKDGKRYHYTWEDRHDSGFSWMGQIFIDHGADIANMDTAPSAAKLSDAEVYIIVDPDHVKDNPNPNYISSADVEIIKKWVSEGGRLLLMTNDTTNADIIHSNKLAQAFGISFTNKNVNFVKNDNFPEGIVYTSDEGGVFTSGQKVYVKELVTLKTKKNVHKAAVKGKDIVAAAASIGKGKVFVIGDPWLYNEYLNGRKLPYDYKNYDAAIQLVQWLLK